MAGSPTADEFKPELPPTTVQEIVQSGNEVPERYIYQSQADHYQSDQIPLAKDCPVIDLGRLSSSTSSRADELKKLQSALSSWGCFQLVNHGIENTLLDDTRSVAKHFFALPREEKLKYSRTAADFQGYGDDAVFEDQIINWNDRLHLRVYPLSHRNLGLWPTCPTKFRDVLHEYAAKSRMIVEEILKATAESLNLEPSSFLSQFGAEEELVTLARFNYYPPSPFPDRTLGFRIHSDGPALNLLLPDDEVEGLHVLKDGKWVQIPSEPHTLFFNVGDQLEIMSNGVFKSVLHRVATNSEKERISISMFFTPPLRAEIGPLSELVTDERPQMYKRVKDYFKMHFRHCPNGERQIDAMRMGYPWSVGDCS